MEVKLMNFGDATRVVHDSRNKPVVVNIGKSKTADLPDRIVHVIRRNMEKGDTLLIVPQDTTPPTQLIAMCDLLSVIGELPYSDLLPRFHALLGHDKTAPRPTIPAMRDALMHEALSYCRAATQMLLTAADYTELNNKNQQPQSDLTDMGGLNGVLGNDGGNNDEGDKEDVTGDDADDDDARSDEVGERGDDEASARADADNQNEKPVKPKTPKRPRRPRNTPATSKRVRLNG